MGGSGTWSPGKVVEVNFKVTGLNVTVDHSGWASTSGVTEGGIVKGNAQDTIMFRVKEV
jgi:hypothetical protein